MPSVCKEVPASKLEGLNNFMIVRLADAHRVYYAVKLPKIYPNLVNRPLIKVRIHIWEPGWEQTTIYRVQASRHDIKVATLVFKVSNGVLRMFEKYTELFKSVAFILVNLHFLVPSNVYDVYFLSRLGRNYKAENKQVLTTWRINLTKSSENKREAKALPA